MQVKDIIKLACTFTENEDMVSAIDNNTLSADQLLILDCLVNCFNLVYDEIATDYIPCLKTQTFLTTSSKIALSEFQSNFIDILSIKDVNGMNLKYKIVDNYVVVNANEVTITYSTHPTKLNVNQSFTSLIPERVFAYGIAREYYFIKTLFDDASVWENRFKDSLQVLSKKKTEVVMPSRRWL